MKEFVHRSLPPHCRVRPAAAGEAPFLSDLASRSKAHWGYAPGFIEACRGELTYSAEQILDPQHFFAVAEVAGELVGFYALEARPDAEFELGALFVEPKWIGCGLGRKLLDHARQIAAARGGRVLSIQADPNAVDFYSAAGAVVTGERESGSIPGRLLPTLSMNLSNSRPSAGRPAEGDSTVPEASPSRESNRGNVFE